MSLQSQSTQSALDSVTPQPLFRQHLETFLTGLAFTLVLSLVAGLPGRQAHSAEIVPSAELPVASELALVSGVTERQTLRDGVHLFGQSPNAEQLNAAYMVFEVNADKVVGAFYMPQSSFDCFQGEVRAEQLALTVTDSYEQTRYPYSMALQQSATVASTGASIAPFRPTGFYPVETISATDQQILNTCRATYQQ
ncbi:hypothetical protein IQ268_27620 [Oculatella sp. LEGE 06141]|uniref:hypothetical protein n=1 Tax=Oculatella sp. LEGE 06141 TaxID=1828648 RepID=UPI0018815D75|nr:hypothetical protein [Oculatella sp. LEGE 06141]MBE9182323.1 hypothetical protein [Oculatella sp. LEGE 06141]